ncbi:uncharacterized protein CLUP02_15121 [Colletotrichum lupini]|uniref:Uncharacterized protein n=1 Tax=Colletotrichum lupini TaxID=145971 RepID=A0A9Q8T693_9PEZI|nr:uncharacterized protein CLUP02_15121 [Colletotrichum lupini]UQC89590.1 hypothetical protein CLUP02_15121 [Colletotrichum lupini]
MEGSTEYSKQQQQSFLDMTIPTPPQQQHQQQLQFESTVSLQSGLFPRAKTTGIIITPRAAILSFPQLHKFYLQSISLPRLLSGFPRQSYHRYGTHPELIPSGGLLRQARNRWGKKAAFLVRGNLQECVKTSLWESGRCRKDFWGRARRGGTKGLKPKVQVQRGRTGANKQKGSKKNGQALNWNPRHLLPPVRPLHSSSTWSKLPYLVLTFKDLASLPTYLKAPFSSSSSHELT